MATSVKSACGEGGRVVRLGRKPGGRRVRLCSGRLRWLAHQRWGVRVMRGMDGVLFRGQGRQDMNEGEEKSGGVSSANVATRVHQ